MYSQRSLSYICFLFLCLARVSAQAQTFPIHFGFSHHQLEEGPRVTPAQLGEMQGFTETWYSNEGRNFLDREEFQNQDLFNLAQLLWTGRYERETAAMGVINAQTDPQPSLGELLGAIQLQPIRELALKVSLRVLRFSHQQSSETPLTLKGVSFVWRDAAGGIQAEWPLLRYLEIQTYPGVVGEVDESDPEDLSALRLILGGNPEVLKFLLEKQLQHYPPQRLELVFSGIDEEGRSQEIHLRLPSFSHLLDVLYSQVPSRQRWDIKPCSWFFKSGRPDQSELP